MSTQLAEKLETLLDPGTALNLAYEAGLESYFRDCLIVGRKDDTTGVLTLLSDKRTWVAHLNGYAIVPIDEYLGLKDLSAEYYRLIEERKRRDQADQLSPA